MPVRDRHAAADCAGRCQCGTPTGMSAALALILLIEAPAACAADVAPRLPGGATLVRPVGTLEPAPYQRLGPPIGLPKSNALRRAGAGHEAGKLSGKVPSAQCAAAPVRIL